MASHAQRPGALRVEVGDVGSLVVGGGGWARFTQDGVDLTVLVKLAEGADGRFRVVALYVSDGHVDGNAVRALALGRLEAAVNRPAVGDALRTCIADALPIVKSTTVVEYGPAVEHDAAEPVTARRVRLRIPIPEGHRKPDEFYRRVAEAYAYQMTRSHHPADDLAAANGVPKSTVSRWVREARARGILSVGRRPGKAT